MASQNRRNYGGYNTQSSGLAFVRGTFIMLVVLILSFGLGFFVLARFMPGSPKSDVNSGLIAGVSNNNSQNETTASLPAASTGQPAPRTPAPRPSPPPAPKTDGNGPTIEPGEETSVQRPGNMEATPKRDSTEPSGKDDNSDKPAAGIVPEPAKKPSRRVKPEPKEPATHADSNDPGDTAAAGKTTGSGDDTEQGVPVKPRKPSHKHLKATGDSPKTPTDPLRSSDPDLAGTPQPRETPESKAPTGGGLYRVQLGAFATREQAEQVVSDAKDKGFDAQIKAINRGGKTLYKVQHSAHKSRANAEKEGQKLTDAGFNVYISNPDK